MTACPHCTKEIADTALDADWVKRTSIKARLDEEREKSAKPHLERVAALTVELKAAKTAAAELPTVRAQLDKLLDADAFRVAGLGESASPDVLRMLHQNALAALPEADRPDFRAWLTSETGAKADPSTAPLLAAWAAAPVTPAAQPAGTPAAAPGGVVAPVQPKPGAPATQPAGQPPTPRAVPNAVAGAVEPAAQRRLSAKELNDEAAQITARWKEQRVTNKEAAEAAYERDMAAWQAKADAAKPTP